MGEIKDTHAWIRSKTCQTSLDIILSRFHATQADFYLSNWTYMRAIKWHYVFYVTVLHQPVGINAFAKRNPITSVKSNSIN